MAGSKNWFRYTSDGAVDYSVQLDESNSEATVGGTPLFLKRSDDYPLLTKGAQLRYCNAFLNDNPAIKRKFYIGNTAAVASIAVGAVISAAVYALPTDDVPSVLNWTVTSYRGEKISLPPAVNATTGDTGLDDGDPGRDS